LALTYSTAGAPTLTRFTGPEPVPPAFDDPRLRVDLVDWDGNGLPDVVQLSPAGTVRIWPNMGACQWGPPRTVASIPALARVGAVTLVDVNGDGLADLVPVDRPLGEYAPRVLTDAGFGQPAVLQQAPSRPTTDPSVRLVDLDGDGAADLLTSNGNSLELFYQEAGGWRPEPQVVGRGEAPTTNLADPHVFLADMTGDGLADMVRVDGGGVTYWPYLGRGRWAAPVEMAHPPALGYDTDPTRLFVVDVDGDGCADLVQLDGDVVQVWINRTGNDFAPPREISAVPTGRMSSVRVADMTGSGAAGLLWTMQARPGEPVYFFLDLTGGSQAYLLTGLDNGVGLRTTMTYSTSAREAARDAALGRPWLTRLPVVLPVVSRIDQADTPTGVVTSRTFQYAEGRWDGPLREFAGFGTVTETQIGDATCPDLQIVTRFAIGLDPATSAEPLTMHDRLTWRAFRGRMLEKARYGPDGTAQATFPFDITTWRWDVEIDGSSYIPHLMGQVETNYERTAEAVSSITTLNTAFDADGNVTRTVQTSNNPADPTQNKQLVTVTSYAADPARRFVAKPARVTQTDGAGTVLADTITVYDGRAEGVAGPQGLITTRSALAMTDAQAAAVYGADQPDFAALGYHRRVGEDGWWVTLATYTRTDSAVGLSGTTTGPMGGTSSYLFDASRTFPTTITDPVGNSVQVTHDYRVNRVSQLTDASGAVYTARFDPLSRMTALVEPGDTATLPTRSFEYDASTVPVTTGIHQRAVSGGSATIDQRERFDGSGRLLERRVRDDAGEVVLESYLYSARGLLATTTHTHRATSAAYARPTAGDAHTTYQYDAIGRPLRITHPDGSTQTTTYEPLLQIDSDAEDNNAGGPHAGTPTRRHLDPGGRIVLIEQNLAGRTISSSYRYNTKGDLVRHTDALGNHVDFQHDCLGRPVLVDRPEKASRSVFDAAGNPVEARSATQTLAVRTFDLLNRPVSVRVGTQATPEVQYTYHDSGAPAPADAGLHTNGGRLVRVDDAGGTTVFDYDERGKAVHKKCRPIGAPGSYLLDSTYRADGQVESITYPGAAGHRLTLTYEYNRRGQGTAVPGVVDRFDYDLQGRRTATHFASGTVQSYTYDPLTDRLATMHLETPSAGSVRDLTYEHDLAGNLLSVSSPDQAQSWTYTFDDLYRLVTAEAGDGLSWDYDFNDVGAITHKSDVGDYIYGQKGAPVVCATSAGPASFSYTAHGEITTGPWGSSVFDELGRLVSITSGVTQTFRYDHTGLRAFATGGGHTRLTPDPLFAIEDGDLVLNLFDGVGVAGLRTPDGHTLYLHPDHLGSLSVVTDDAGAVVDSLRYDPFGAVLARTGAGAAQARGYVGGEPDPFTGLLYLSARWYSPEFGVFLSADILVPDAYDPLSWASYAYCRNNPVTFADPSGRSLVGIVLACVAIAALIVVTIVSYGTASGVTAVGIGVIVAGAIAGGVVGGIAAYKKGGDVLEGVLVGAAVGG
jgi:RHS repeat-associated protein